MAVTASGTATGPRRRYAPEDPTLPKPWRGLVDLSTGYLYFWNPETNITQYERPVSASSPPPTSKSESTLENPSVQFQQPSGSSIQDTGATCCHSQNALSGSTSAGYGAESVRSSGVYQPVDMGVGSSESYRRRHEITVIGNNVPAPFMTFQSTGFPSEILREVCHAGFSAPTPIQAQSWPIALQNRDIVAVAKTGSGKTLGYLIPGFIHLKRRQNNSRLGPSVLVLAPTRELATQIQDEAVKFASSSKISSTCLYGGAPKGPQLRDLDRGTDIVVATPGRLNDILGMKRVNLQQVSYLVLDEADRMLDMGFEPQIRQIVKEIPTRRQTLMYTATWPKEVRKIAADLMVTPVQVNIGNVDELVANKSITQYVEVMTHLEKRRRLEQILRSQEPGSKAIVFCSTKKMCDQLSSGITRQFGAASIHGDKSQDERDRVLNQFRSGKSPVLVATDVAARGLDIKDIRVVVNYDFPTGVEDYVHRIGRTGRAGATGVAYTFFCDQDAKHASNLIKVLEGASQQVPPDLRAMVGRGGGMGGSRRWGSSSGHEGGRSYGAGQSDSNDGDYGGGMGGSRRWDSSSGGHEGDRSLGAGQSDSNDGDSGGGWGAISSGWSERFRSGQGHEGSEPCDRRDEGGFPGTNNDRTDDREHRHVNSPGSRSRSRSRSQSPSRRDVHPAF